MIDTLIYRNYRNLLTKLIRKSKNHNFRSLFDKNKNDIKYTWKIVNDLLGKRSNRKKIKSLIVNGNEIALSKDIAREFNGYFASVAEELESQIPSSPHCPSSYFHPSKLNSFFLCPVTVEECKCIITKLKNTKYDLDNIPVSLLCIKIY